ncbi:MAG TPA: hypothetical protein VFJ58_25115 [Armatimonadota bacterium]|nr:hypothetical protein [Armatimonadota bacterium]
MKKSVPVPVIAILIAVIVVVIGFLGYRAVQPPASGGVYTPGVPPWKDPKEMKNGQAPAAAPAQPPAPAAPAAGH